MSVVGTFDPASPGPSTLALRRDPAFASWLASSHRDHVGRDLVPVGMAPREAALWLYAPAPFGLLAHNAAPDPRFV